MTSTQKPPQAAIKRASRPKSKRTVYHPGLEALQKISMRISSTLDLKEVLNLLVESTLQLIPADAAQIFIYVPQSLSGERLQFGAAKRRSQEHYASEADIPRPDGITATVAFTGKPVIMDQAREHPLFSQPDEAGRGVEALASFPLIKAGRVLGVYSITFYRPFTFSMDDRHLLALLADQAAIAIENARLYQAERRRADELNIIFTLSRMITQNLDFEQVFDSAFQAITRLMPTEAFYITLRDRESGDVVAMYLMDKGVRYPPHRRPPEAGLAGYIIRSGESVIIHDLDQDSVPFEVFHYGSDEHVRSILAVPLRFGAHTMGMLSTQSYTPNVYSEHDLHLLQNIADHAAVAVENAYLYDDLQKRYEGLQELESVRTEVLQNVTHELRNPLTYLTGYIELLLQDELGTLNESQRKGLMVLKAKTATLVRLVEDINILETHIEGWLRLEEISLPGIARNTVAMFEPPAAARNIEICVQAPEKFPRVSADPDRISEVFDNLLSNALKFSTNDSKIVVKLEATPEFALVSISDQGEGIPKKEQELIFKRHYQVNSEANRRHSGQGLGLAIVKRIVEAHRGQVWVASEQGAGSTFYFTLPYYQVLPDSHSEKG